MVNPARPTLDRANTYREALTRIINDGIEAAKKDYDGHKLAGAIAGFEACRDKEPQELADILADARAKVQRLYGGDLKEYWSAVCFSGEVEWVCNVLSAILQQNGFDVLVPPTVNGWRKAAEIIGVAA